MEKLSVEKRTEVSKMSTERLRARLIKAGMMRMKYYDHLLGRRPTSSKTGASGSLSTRSRQRSRPLVPGNDE